MELTLDLKWYSYSGLHSPGRSNSTYFWNNSWVQTFHRDIPFSTVYQCPKSIIILGAVADPDLQIKCRGRSHKIFFRAFRPQFGLKIRVATPGLSPGSGTRGIPAMDLEEQKGGGGEMAKRTKIVYLPTFSESNAWDFHLACDRGSENVPLTLEDFWQLLNVSEMSKDVWETFEQYFEAI